MAGLDSQRPELTIFVTLFALVTVLGFVAARWRRSTGRHALEEWGLGGRAFGTGISFFLLGGGLYTAYSFVAVPALVYGAGAAGFFAVAFATITVPLVFVALPRLWSVAHVHGLVTSAEFVRARFGSPTLSLLVAITAIVATLPYIALQLVGLQAVFKVMGISGHWPLAVAFGIVALFTFNSGLRAPALISIVKDLLILVIAGAALLAVARTGSGWAGVFRASAQKFAHVPSFGGGLLLTPTSQVSYVTLAVGSALGLFLYPHAITGALAARNRATIKRSLAILPVYTLTLGAIALLGYAAIADHVLPLGADPATGRGGDPNTIVLLLFHSLLNNAGAGIAYAAIGIGALVPASIMSIAAANLFARDIYRQFVRPHASTDSETRVSRWTSLIVKLGAISVIVFLTPQFSIDLQLIGGVIILQVLPAVAIGLYRAWFHRWALIAGLVAGLVTGIGLLYQIPSLGPNGSVVNRHFGGASWPLAHLGFNTGLTVYAGLVALAVNLAVATAGTLVARWLAVPDGTDITRPYDYIADEGDRTVQRLPELVDGRPRYEGRHAG